MKEVNALKQKQLLNDCYTNIPKKMAILPSYTPHVNLRVSMPKGKHTDTIKALTNN